MITPKYFNPATFFVPLPSQEFLASVCSFVFTFSLVMLLEYLGVTISLYLCIMLFWDQLQPVLWCEGFLIFHWRLVGGLELKFFIPVGLLSLRHNYNIIHSCYIIYSVIFLRQYVKHCLASRNYEISVKIRILDFMVERFK